VIFRGKVVMEDGSPPGFPVSIQRSCEGLDHVVLEATVSPKTGDYFVRLTWGAPKNISRTKMFPLPAVGDFGAWRFRLFFDPKSTLMGRAWPTIS
jgi:hypothetical protein